MGELTYSLWVNPRTTNGGCSVITVKLFFDRIYRPDKLTDGFLHQPGKRLRSAMPRIGRTYQEGNT
jgi:hypothetical protein